MPKVLIVVPARDGAKHLKVLLPKLLRQDVLPGWCHWICVVDDGSSDSTGELLGNYPNTNIIALHNATPVGRARACDQGSVVGDSDFLFFLDVDCVPTDSKWVRRHVEALSAGNDLSVGPVLARGKGFWENYLRRVAEGRHRAALEGDFLALTSANLAIRRESWCALGGFSERYTHYGFEDRDLLARAMQHGMRIVYTPGAAVITDPPRTVSELSRKSEIAGRCSASLFRETHPSLYRQMSFWWFDARVGPAAIRWFARPLASLAQPTASIAEWLANVESVPCSIRLLLVRTAIGLAFMRGTLASNK